MDEGPVTTRIEVVTVMLIGWGSNTGGIPFIAYVVGTTTMPCLEVCLLCLQGPRDRSSDFLALSRYTILKVVGIDVTEAVTTIDTDPGGGNSGVFSVISF